MKIRSTEYDLRELSIYCQYGLCLDASKGFGGKFGVQEDRKDASAHGWQPERKVAPAKSKPRIDSVVSVGNIKSMFEKPAVSNCHVVFNYYLLF